MQTWMALLGLSVAIFLSTNLDDLLVLLAFQSDARYRAFDVVLGQDLGAGILFFLSVVASRAATRFTPDRVGWLGLLPVLIGIKHILNSSRARSENAAGPIKGRVAAFDSRIWTVAGVAIANGGDNLIVCIPQFAIRPAPEIMFIGLVFAVMTALWCVFARAIFSRSVVGKIIRVFGQRFAPWALITLGVVTLCESSVVKPWFH